FSGSRVEGGDERTYAAIPARHADDDLVLEDERRVRDRVLVPGAGGLDVPEDPAGLGVDREQVRVDGPEVQRVAENRESAAHAPAARTGVHGGTILRRPIRTAGDAVERNDLIDAPDGWSLHGVQHAVDGQRRGFEFLERPGLPNPLQLGILDVLRVS